jgi:hypothetical protein
MAIGLLHDLLTTHRDDPANTRYLVPLDNPEDEEMPTLWPMQFTERWRSISGTTSPKSRPM